MDSGDIIATLRWHEPDLRARGVQHAALFGSVARGTAGPESDIDIDPDAARDIYAYVGLKTYVAGLFTGSVDVVDREALRPEPAGTDGLDFRILIQAALRITDPVA